jgi:spore germination protein (amino acid permease)
MNSTNRITSKQLALFILAAQIGAGMIILPYHLVYETGHDGWLSLLLTGILSTIAIVPIMLLLRRYHDKSIYQINPQLFGHWIGKALNFSLLLYLIFLTIVGIRLFAEFIRLFQLEQIPPLMINLLIIVPTVYLTRYGLKPVARFSAFLLVILTIFLLSAWLVKSDIRLSFLEPVGVVGWGPILKNIPICFISFIGFELTAFVYPAVTDRDQALKWVIIANLVATFFFVALFLVTTGLFGEELLKRMVSPLFSLSRYIKISLVERIDLISFLLWFPLAESSFRSYFFSAYDGFRSFFRIENRSYILLLFTVALVLLSGIPADLNQVLQLMKLVNFTGIAVITFLIVCYGFSFLNRRGVKNND